MTAPTYQSTTVTDFGSDATAHLANMPATVNTGDLLLAIVGMDASCTITTPAGWTQIAGGATDYNNLDMGIYAKVAAGSEGGGTVGFTTSNAQRGSIHVIRATAWFGALDGGIVAMIGQIGGSSTQAFSLGIGASKDLLLVLAEIKSQTTAWNAGPPTGYSNDNKTGAGEDSTSSCSIASATRTATENHEEVSNVWNMSTNWTVAMIAILPAAGGGGGGSGGSPIVGSTIVRAA